MKVNSTNSVNFGSSFVLARKLSEEEGSKLMEHFRMDKSSSPFLVYDVPENGINQVISVFDKYDHLVKNYLAKIGVGIEKESSSLDAVTERIRQLAGDVFQSETAAKRYIDTTNWKLPAELPDK
ncbi:MAG: hypothetical protein WCY19_00510 [Candidatus Gastranaerophilaceae bacterium]